MESSRMRLAYLRTRRPEETRSVKDQSKSARKLALVVGDEANACRFVITMGVSALPGQTNNSRVPCGASFSFQALHICVSTW